MAMVVVSLVAALIGTVGAVLRWGDISFLAKWVSTLSPIILWIAGIRVELEGEENTTVQQPCLYMINHQSGLDLFTFGLVAPPNTTVIAKRELQWAPLLGLFFKATGVIFINRKDRQGSIDQLTEAANNIRTRGVSVAIAPEGTRNPKGEGLLPFKKGPFHLAIKAQVPIVPCLSSSLYPLGSFSERRLRPGVMQVKFLPPISTAGYSDEDLEKLMTQTREAMLRGQSDMKTIQD
jgi:lysophosphatidate acyltransferase